MRRTQLYLDEELWNALRTRARREKTTISDLVRRSARERYLGDLEARQGAMQAFVGIRSNRSDVADAVKYVRRLRRGRRIERFARS